MPANITINITEDTLDKMELYKKITGREVDVETCIRESICMYVPDDGIYKEAIFLKGASVLDQLVAKNEGRASKVEEIPCYVLKKVQMYNEPYFRIVAEGRLLTVPATLVNFPKKNTRKKQKK